MQPPLRCLLLGYPNLSADVIYVSSLGVQPRPLSQERPRDEPERVRHGELPRRTADSFHCKVVDRWDSLSLIYPYPKSLQWFA